MAGTLSLPHEMQELSRQNREYRQKPQKDEQRLRDDQTLIRLGKAPVLKRNFGFLSMLGLSSAIMVTWESVFLLLATPLTNGGLAGSVYGFVFVWIGTTASFITMAELASMAPTAAGQYHWVAMLAPDSVRVFLSYMLGWFLVIGWQATLGSGCFLSAQLIQGLIVLNNPEFAPAPWQTMLLFWATVGASILVNTVIARYLPKLEGLLLILHVLGFVGILVTLLYFGPHGNVTEVFTSFSNGGDWPTQGLSFMVGILGPVYNLLGADAAVHMSEEIVNPQRNVPRGIVFGVILNGLVGFGTLIALLFCLGDVDEILGSPTGFPFIAVFYQAVENVPGASTMTAIITIMSFAGAFSIVATASRMTWSFARDRGLPGWRVLRRIGKSTTLPLWSIALTCFISILLSLIILGSNVAFNDLVSVAVTGLYSSYLTGNTLLLWRRLRHDIRQYDAGEELTNTVGSKSLSWGPWRVSEPLGSIINLFGCLYMIVVLFFSFWPVTNNPSPAEMNYSSAIVGGVLAFAVLYYFVRGRSEYKGPVVERDLAHVRSEHL